MRKYRPGQEVEILSSQTLKWHPSVILGYLDHDGVQLPGGDIIKGYVYLCDTSDISGKAGSNGAVVEQYIRPRPKKPTPPVIDYEEMIKDLKNTKPKETVKS